MKAKMKISAVLIVIGSAAPYSMARAEMCRFTYDNTMIVPTYSYVYTDSTVSVFLDGQVVYSGFDRYKVLRDVKFAVNTVFMRNSMRDCYLIDGESLELSFNDVVYRNISTVHECNTFDSTSLHAIFRLRSGFYLSKSDVYTKNKEMFDSLREAFIMGLKNDSSTPIEF